MECCGVVARGRFYVLGNLSGNSHEFLMDPVQLYAVMKKSGWDVDAIVHSHEESCNPSPVDLYSMRIWRKIWVIVGRNCVRALIPLSLGVVEVDLNSLFPEEVYHSIMEGCK
jgi:proteasome lid subunit RPN8/RPN11